MTVDSPPFFFLRATAQKRVIRGNAMRTNHANDKRKGKKRQANIARTSRKIVNKRTRGCVTWCSVDVSISTLGTPEVELAFTLLKATFATMGSATVHAAAN